ncbi:molybdopterin-guanine dinucleotide biosynthesis protein B [Bacillus benzoevorans]|uniref:Molybdopterin-guanine dinucleotide biosynthesis protein B n=1 Tax=Bacillus benzoevorans TaxID=1456 RepID=A0A7X0HMR8_9BACI|nr:molybdopterin-guanine dinucleotide biosynthesis protein B [Bacillus benzoevorans]MBB6443523.1 molybdopterin-guanine dinucleotide biosynthesis protein B [Bacillus benzoevorans]
MDKPFIFQITGYQNSGKTTYLNKLLTILARQNVRTVTLKHHGHGGKPNVVEDADSACHIASGAAASLVEGGGRLLLQTENIAWTLEEEINLLTLLRPELILIEGHKHEHFPKLVFLRDRNDVHLLSDLKNIIAVIYQNQEPEEVVNLFPVFHRNDPASIAWVLNYIMSQVIKK